MNDFGMELEAEIFLARFSMAAYSGILRGGDRFETIGQLGEFVAVGIPNLERLRQFGEQRAHELSFTVSVPLPYSRLRPFSTLPPRKCAKVAHRNRCRARGRRD